LHTVVALYTKIYGNIFSTSFVGLLKWYLRVRSRRIHTHPSDYQYSYHQLKPKF
jgi:hypothetical protein